ncbi:MAG: toprim domain-containing protein [Candidatus Doudnabacteria bacterium]|nr:toprim domain-containing protein [Candidatus Doudnabacteria bacterium]
MVFETVIEKDSKVEYEVESTKNGENPQVCPVCSLDRKKKKDKCLSYNTEKGTGNCNHCHRVFYKKQENHKSYVRPEWTNKTQLSDKIVEWFLSRNINQDTLIKMRVTESIEWFSQVKAERKCINFNYFRAGKLINVKYRDGEKNFKLVKDAEKIFYNIDGIKDQKEIYIVEGEMDCLTMIQQGITNTISVPNGATTSKQNLEYMDNCWQSFEEAERVYIVTDHDQPGEQLGMELARRIGVEKCFRVYLGEFKDVNEQFCKTGKVDLSDARAYPIVGIFTVEDYWESVEHIDKFGFPKGWKPRGKLGEHLSFHPGYKTIVTGIPGHGKSEFVDQMLLQLCVDHNLRGAFFSPENAPTEVHIIKLVEKVSGKRFGILSAMEKQKARVFLNDHVYWTYPEEEGFSLDSILNKVRQAVLKYGVSWFVIDPWNRLDHQYTVSETKYISESLDKISNFNAKNGTHSFIVAHPTKMKFNHDKNCYEMPGLYDIAGSANFYNKADIGLTIYKDPDQAFHNIVAIQKVKFKYWGEGVGKIEYNWNKDNGRYDEYGPDLNNWLKEQVTVKPIDFTISKRENDEVPF